MIHLLVDKIIIIFMSVQNMTALLLLLGKIFQHLEFSAVCNVRL